MTPQDPLDAYIVRLRSALRGMTVAEREDICEEIRTHVRERVAGSGLTVGETLAKLGLAEELGRAYMSGALVRRARISFSPWLILRAAYAWAMTGVHGIAVFMTAVLGYALGLGFMICAMLKPIFPDETGLWIGPGIFDFGFRPGNVPDAREVLGPWFMQVSIVLGILFFLGTTLAMRVLLPRFQHWRASAMSPGESRPAPAAAHVSHVAL